MPAPSARYPDIIRTLSIAVILLVAVIDASASPDRLGVRMPEREQRIRVALSQQSPKLSQEAALRRRRAPASLNLLVVGFDFSDSLMWGRDLDEFEGWPPQTRQSKRIPETDILMFDAHDSVYFDLEIGRVDAYFRTVSFGAFGMDWSVHAEIQNLPHQMRWFADPDSGTVRLARAAQDIADAIDPVVDFTGVDTFVLIHAGAGSETDIDDDSPEQIPSNYLDRRDLEEAVEAGLLDVPMIVTDEGDLEHILILPESETQDAAEGVPGSGFFDVRGVYCYEFGLRLGMLSLADFTPGYFPDSQGIGNFGLMGYGLFTGLGIVPSAPSAVNRMLMGWADAVVVDSDADLRIVPMLDPATVTGDTNLVRVPVSEREYWLLEYRLQDPDGDLFYGFEDLNSNNLPDYYDASNAANGGVPNSTFDPDEDTWEEEEGAEVDFFMSENPVRPPDGCRRGGGSGLYIWHVDEQVIENALNAGTNTINSDPKHKGVDVEEADGIQDLDTAYSGLWLLGADQDVWRGEGQPEFGPTTSPSTASAAGLPTGVRFSEFSNVGVDTLPKSGGYCTGFVYANAMRLRVEFGAEAGGPMEQARARMDGYGPQFDLRVLDLGSSPASAALDGIDEIVAVADSGRVFAFNGDLSPFAASGPEPGLLAVATSGDSVQWTGPPTIVDFSAGARRDILVAGNAGIFGFDLDGNELADGDMDPSTYGRLADPGGLGLGPLINFGQGAVQSVQTDAGLQLVAVEADGGGVTIARSEVVEGAIGSGHMLGLELAPGVPVADATVWTGFERDGQAGHVLWDSGVATVDAGSPDEFSSSPVVQADLGADVTRAWIDGADRLVAGETEASRTGTVVPRPRSPLIAAPVSDGGSGWVVAFTTANELYAFDANLSVLPGFPVSIRGSVAAPADVRPLEPAAVDLDGDGTVELIWCDASGGIHATDLGGRELSGWPVQGPATPVSAPALGQFDDDPALEMVVAGRFERLVGTEGGSSGHIVRPTGDLRVYDLAIPADGYRPWSQALAGVDNAARQTLAPGPAKGSGIVDDSFSVRPNPVTGSVVRLRADAAGELEARLDIYTIEGERVLSQGPFSVPAGTALDVEFRIDELGSGTYICQLTAGGAVQRRLLAVVR